MATIQENQHIRQANVVIPLLPNLPLDTVDAVELMDENIICLDTYADQIGNHFLKLKLEIAIPDHFH